MAIFFEFSLQMSGQMFLASGLEQSSRGESYVKHKLKRSSIHLHSVRPEGEISAWSNNYQMFYRRRSPSPSHGAYTYTSQVLARYPHLKCPDINDIILRVLGALDIISS